MNSIDTIPVENPTFEAPSNEETSTRVGGIAGHILRSFLERIERLEEEKKALQEDIRDVYKEAKMSGFDPKIMRKIIALRKLDRHERQELEYLVDTYMRAVEVSGETS